MYKYEDFKDNIDQRYMIDMIDHAKDCFNLSFNIVRGETLLNSFGCDYYIKIACIDKLVELGYISIIYNAEFAKDRIYRNIRL